ncbi:MAG: hypothetical protein CMB53_05310 [Euryarchaeota archaeon]|nr:hypothetical protein [Euryarchaeota archaeon]|tara:strand:- start:5430 stop:6044 length:615 start_codon:yes stop_codon:yes gene_type:complete
MGFNKEEDGRGEEEMVKDTFRGMIFSSSFGRGDRIVIGNWEESPLGKFTNVMWADPSGKRTLLSPSEKHSEYVSSLYTFEEIRITPIDVKISGKSISVQADDLSVTMHWGYTIPIPIPRPLWFISSVENFFARILFGTKTHGMANNGNEEWYSVRGISWLKSASAKVSGKDLGIMSRRLDSACFGFSEPPIRPAAVTLSSIIQK